MVRSFQQFSCEQLSKKQLPSHLIHVWNEQWPLILFFLFSFFKENLIPISYIYIYSKTLKAFEFIYIETLIWNDSYHFKSRKTIINTRTFTKENLYKLIISFQSLNIILTFAFQNQSSRKKIKYPMTRCKWIHHPSNLYANVSRNKSETIKKFV